MSGSLARTIYLNAGSSAPPNGYWWPTKEPDSFLDYTANCYGPLADGGNLAITYASVACAPSGSGELSIDSLVLNGVALQMYFSGGVPGRTYTFKLEFGTTARSWEFLIQLPMDSKYATCPLPAPPSTGFGTAVVIGTPPTPPVPGTLSQILLSTSTQVYPAYGAEINVVGGATNISALAELGFTAMFSHFYTYDGTEQFRVGSVPNATEVFEMRGGITGAGPTIYATGITGNDINLTVACQGNGGMTFVNWFGPMFTIGPAPGEVPYNYIQFLARSSGNPGSIFFSGADTNVNGYLSAQGSGIIYVANSSGPIGANSAPIGQFGNSSGAACTDQWRMIGQASSKGWNHQISGLNGGDVSIGSIDDGGSVLATTAQKGFLRIPTMAGAPTATPAITDNFMPMVYDTTDDRLYFYNGSWKPAPIMHSANASPVNYLQLSANSTTNPTIIDSVGSDANIGMWLRVKGTGNLAILSTTEGTLASFNNNGGAATDHPTFYAATSSHNVLLKTASVANIAIGGGVLATSATVGFLVIPSSPGTPTGTPVLPTGDGVPIEFDTTNGLAMVYQNAAWTPLAGKRTLYVTGVVVGNTADETEDVLQTYTLAAALLKNVGDRVRIVAAGSFASSSDTRTVRFRVGSISGSSLMSFQSASSGVTKWSAEAEILKTASDTQSFFSTGSCNSGSFNPNSGTLTLTDTNQIAIIISGQDSSAATANAVTCQYFYVEYIPNGA